MPFLAAALQMQTGPDRAHNLARALALLADAVARGAKLLALPEMWEHIGPAKEKAAFAGPLDGAQLAPSRFLRASRAPGEVRPTEDGSLWP